MSYKKPSSTLDEHYIMDNSLDSVLSKCCCTLTLSALFIYSNLTCPDQTDTLITIIPNVFHLLPGFCHYFTHKLDHFVLFQTISQKDSSFTPTKLTNCGEWVLCFSCLLSFSKLTCTVVLCCLTVRKGLWMLVSSGLVPLQPAQWLRRPPPGCLPQARPAPYWFCWGRSCSWSASLGECECQR